MNIKKIIIYSIILNIFISYNFYQPANAGLFDIFKKKKEVHRPVPFPTDEKTFVSGTKLYRDMPFNDDRYEFQLSVPNNWKINKIYSNNFKPKLSSLNIVQTIPTDLIIIKSPIIKTLQAFISIQSLNLNHQISIKPWMEYYALANGYNINGDIEKLGDKKVKISFTSFIKGKQMYSSIVAQINHNIVMLVRFDMPYPFKRYMTFLQKRTLDSFKILSPILDPIEEMKTLYLNNALKLRYPESWHIYNKKTKYSKHMSFKLYSEISQAVEGKRTSNKINGVIRMDVIKRSPDTNLLNEIDKEKERFSKHLKINFKELISSKKSKAYDRFVFSREEVYIVTPKSSDSLNKYLDFVVLGDKDWYVLAYMYSPSKEEDLYNWARNKASFELVIRNIK